MQITGSWEQAHSPGMRSLFTLVLGAAMAIGSLQKLSAQDLAPRAYVITPLHSNAIILSYSFFDGDINYNGALPINGASGTYSVPIIGYYHAFGFFGRSANIVAVLPYGVGNFQGKGFGADQQLYRSGLLDSGFRFSVNLKGGPAMPPQKFMKWQQKTLIGASLRVLAPTGQYDPTRLINWGANRWAFKPELGYSRRWRNWVLDGYFGVWFFTTNQDFFSRNSYYVGDRSQSQKPIGAFDGHLSYDFKPRLWVSLDGNFWFGGKTSVNGIENSLTFQANSRIGGTVSVPISKHQSLKFSYSDGAYTRFGGTYHSVTTAWQYSWLGRPN